MATITEVKGDAIALNREMKDACLIHVCNNYAVMGSGIALQIKNEHPSAYKVYRNHCNHHNKYNKLTGSGGVSVYDYQSRIFNMIAQDNYGKIGSNRYLNYGWLGKCLSQIPDEIESINDHPVNPDITKVIVPVLMGAMRAGGDWEIVKEMVIGMLGDVFDEIIFCEFNKG